MARLPAIQFDTSGFQQANSLMLRGAENAAAGDAALGQGIGQGLGMIGAGFVRRRAERKADQRHQESLDFRNKTFDRNALESDRVFELRRLEGAAKLIDDDLTAAELQYQMAQTGAALNPTAMFSPEFKEAESRYQEALSQKQSILRQYQELSVGEQKPTHRHTMG